MQPVCLTCCKNKKKTLFFSHAHLPISCWLLPLCFYYSSSNCSPHQEDAVCPICTSPSFWNVVMQHQYFLFSGSWDWKDMREIGLLEFSSFSTLLQNSCRPVLFYTSACHLFQNLPSRLFYESIILLNFVIAFFFSCNTTDCSGCYDYDVLKVICMSIISKAYALSSWLDHTISRGPFPTWVILWFCSIFW